MKRRNDKYNNHLLKSYETVMDFAFRKMVYATSVYSAIEKGKTVMIDLTKYGAYKFQVRNPDKSAMIRWYLSVGYEIKGKKAQRKAQAILFQSSKKSL